MEALGLLAKTIIVESMYMQTIWSSRMAMFIGHFNFSTREMMDMKGGYLAFEIKWQGR